MTNLEKQADEILVLQSIFDQKVRVLNHNQYEILIDFDLIHPFHIQYRNQTSTIHCLPSFIRIIRYYDKYPSDYPPSFILSCFYFSKGGVWIEVCMNYAPTIIQRQQHFLLVFNKSIPDTF